MLSIIHNIKGDWQGTSRLTRLCHYDARILSMNSLNDVRIAATLERLHKAAQGDFCNLARPLAQLRRLTGGHFKADMFGNAYFAISRDKGEFIYTMLRAAGAKRIVEFGTSFGISTIYLAAAARDNGAAAKAVTTSEIVAEKCTAAQANFVDAGLSHLIDLREGDALQTLKTITEPIDCLFLDGWKDLYVPILELLKPRLRSNALLIADNAALSSAAAYTAYLRKRPREFATHFLRKDAGGLEFSCYLAA